MCSFFLPYADMVLLTDNHLKRFATLIITNTDIITTSRTARDDIHVNPQGNSICLLPEL